MSLKQLQTENENLRFANLYMHDVYNQMKDAKEHAERRWLEAIEFLELFAKDRTISPYHKDAIDQMVRKLKELPE